MVDLALQLNWEGEQEVYSGESKNTALLYEYWLFLNLEKLSVQLIIANAYRLQRSRSLILIMD